MVSKRNFPLSIAQCRGMWFQEPHRSRCTSYVSMQRPPFWDRPGGSILAVWEIPDKSN